jgi:hypothetical protein
MREITNKKKILEFMQAFARPANQDVRVYFTGGATAVLFGWRETTIDIDLRFEPELDELFRSIQNIKETLQINVELAAPSDFIPELPGWETRSQYIGREGKVSYYHYDPYSQTLAKIERSHAQDLTDVESMMQEGLVDRKKLLELFQSIESQLYKYPAIDPDSFSRSVRAAIGE